jgi:hypothetical protein
MSYLPLSFSSMKEFSKSPAHFLHYKNKTRTPSTPAQAFGKLVHTMLLEPSEVTARYAVAPKVNRATTLGKQAWEKFTFENPNKEHVTADIMATAQETRDAVMRHEEAADLITGATHYELHVEGEIHGLDFHGYVDALDGEQGILTDLKTCQDHSASAFSRTVAQNKYYLQAAIYEALTGHSTYHLIAVESAAPHCVGVYQLSEQYMDAGRYELESLCKSFREWLDRGTPEESSATGVTLIYPPSWML